MTGFGIIRAAQSRSGGPCGRAGCLLLAAMLFAGCGTRPSASEDGKAIVSGPLLGAIAEFNRGAALLEQYEYSSAAEAFEAALDAVPDWDAARFNLGLAYLNMQEKPGAEDYLTEARAAFEAVLQRDPNHLHARFSLGLYHQHVGQIEESLECFRAVHRADSSDPYVAYKYAEALINLGRTEEGTRMLEEVIALDPGFVSAVYRLATQYQRARQREKAMPLFNRFRDLNKAELTGGSFTVLKVYGSVGKYYMALGADSLPLLSAETTPQTRILFSPEVTAVDAEIPDWKYHAGAVAVPGIATGDVDGDGDLDLCLAALGTDGTTSIWHNDGAGRFSRGATLAQQGISPCFGDMDNDGDLDLWLGRAGPDIFFENDGKGNFSEAELVDMADETGLTSAARLLDIDSDGDLDFLAFRLTQGSAPGAGVSEKSAGSLYNNNGDGSFTDIAGKLGLAMPDRTVTAAVYDDFDSDRDLDLVVFGKGDGGAVVWVNDRVWQYHQLDAEATGLSARSVRSATSGDPDKDGDRDLLIFTDNGLQLFVNQGSLRFARHQGFTASCGRLGGTGGQFADMDNDGDLDIVIADASRPDGGRGPALLINDWPRDRFIDAVAVDPGNLFA
ncbi:MAG: VCBS repeat-containing protein, partial [Phycisphaerales bacterium]